MFPFIRWQEKTDDMLQAPTETYANEAEIVRQQSPTSVSQRDMRALRMNLAAAEDKHLFTNLC